MRPLLLALAAVLLTDAASAQRHRPFAQRGDLAAFVSVRGLADIRIDPALGGVGLRYRLGDQTVLGTSVGFSLFENDRDSDGGGRDGETSQTSTTASVWLEQHVGSRRRTISPLVGVGVRYRFREYDSEEDRTIFPCGDPGACDPVLTSQLYETSENAVSGAAFLGAEVRVIRGVTVGAAYGVGAELSRREFSQVRDDGESQVVEDFEDERVSVGTGLSSFFLSVYF